jgi:hypothetical protein
MQPGYQTTEFWLAVIPVIGAVIVAVIQALNGGGNGVEVAGALLASAGASVGYSRSRGVVKAAEATPTP